MKLLKWLVPLSLVGFLIGCQGDNTGDTDEPAADAETQTEVGDDGQEEEQMLTGAIEVELDAPDEAAVNTAVETKAAIIEEGEPVAEADVSSVRFEFWKAGDRENSWKEDGEVVEEGTYTAEATFEADGLYYVQSHVTARGTHVMPKDQIVVGEMTEEDIAAAEKEEEESGVSDMDSMEGMDHEGH
ncbi:hypothetical protein G4V62_14545 [Bacillaceae bacterium SIJ1]|uniref:FixH family protein n=1 Tax=Litoribacterium kuwaitense TaxID=1398745 RepID=UPI0013ED5A03|nr:FixH family protein [Litoribacterium kuwaitense]NGP46111.1 hypothetical protein [Litoribacterium kuwaitense]